MNTKVRGSVAGKYDTVAKMKAGSFVLGQQVETKGYTSAGDGGGAKYLAEALGTPDGDGDHATGDGNFQLTLIKVCPVNVRKYGATGGDEAVDSAAFQACMTANLHVFAPTPTTPYILSNILPNRGQVIEGDTKYDGGAGTTSNIIGNGTDPVFLCGDGGVTALREITFRNLNADGNTQEVVKGRFSPNMGIYNCYFKTASATKNTIDLENCFRSYILFNRLSCSGGGWAVQGYQDFNGCSVDMNTISGGALGGAINLGISTGSSASRNTIETSLKGIFISANSDAGNGNANGITIDANYIEDCSAPFSFGEQFTVQGLVGSANYVGNTNLTLAADSVVKWGRVKQSRFTNNSFHVNAAEDVYDLVLNQATGDQEDNYFGGDTIFGTPANLYVLSGTQAASGSVQKTVGWQNYYPFVSDLSTREPVVFESGTITADVGLTAFFAFNDFNPLGLGGKIIKVEVFEKSGTITSTLSAGRSGNGSEIISVDPETLSYVNGRADVTLITETATLRSTEDAVYRVTAGVGTGTFRVRITYRVT